MRRVAENCSKHLTCRSYTVLTNGMAIELKRQFNIAVAKQRLDCLRIGSDADQERRQTVPKIVEAEPTGIILH